MRMRIKIGNSVESQDDCSYTPLSDRGGVNHAESLFCEPCRGLELVLQ
jgi:hypothetical protein